MSEPASPHKVSKIYLHGKIPDLLPVIPVLKFSRID